jgi:hypothetical protein
MTIVHFDEKTCCVVLRCWSNHLYENLNSRTSLLLQSFAHEGVRDDGLCKTDESLHLSRSALALCLLAAKLQASLLLSYKALEREYQLDSTIHEAALRLRQRTILAELPRQAWKPMRAPSHTTKHRQCYEGPFLLRSYYETQTSERSVLDSYHLETHVA